MILKYCKCITIPHDIQVVKTAFEYFKCFALQTTVVRNTTAEVLRQ